MSLSKPIYSMLGAYLEQMFNHPLRTKSITSCILSIIASLTSQKMAGDKKIKMDSVLAYGLYGFFLGGTMPHYFYQLMDHRIIARDLKLRKFYLFLAERLSFAPIYQFVLLYFLSRFEMKTHEATLVNMKKLYWPLLKANWQYLSAAVLINMTYVPPMLRSLVFNIISFIWVVYIARKRRTVEDQAKKEKSSSSGIIKNL